MKELSQFVMKRRNEVGLTQEEFAEKAGVALTIRKIEQNKTNLNLDKINHVLKMFGHKLVPVSLKKLKFDEIIYEVLRSHLGLDFETISSLPICKDFVENFTKINNV